MGLRTAIAGDLITYGSAVYTKTCTSLYRAIFVLLTMVGSTVLSRDEEEADSGLSLVVLSPWESTETEGLKVGTYPTAGWACRRAGITCSPIPITFPYNAPFEIDTAVVLLRGTILNTRVGPTERSIQSV